MDPGPSLSQVGTHQRHLPLGENVMQLGSKRPVVREWGRKATWSVSPGFVLGISQNRESLQVVGAKGVIDRPAEALSYLTKDLSPGAQLLAPFFILRPAKTKSAATTPRSVRNARRRKRISLWPSSADWSSRCFRCSCWSCC